MSTMRYGVFASDCSKWARPAATFVFAAAVVVGYGRALWGQGPDVDAVQKRETLAAEMKQISECLWVSLGAGAAAQPLPVRREPLQRWNDPTMGIGESTLWAFGERGRPIALVTMELSADPARGKDAQSWGLEFILLTNEALTVEGRNELRSRNAPKSGNSKPVLGGDIHWTPTPPGLAFRDVPDAPSPAPTAQSRLLQMKELVRRFSAVAHPTQQPSLLRLMPHPIDRYSDPEVGQIDGTIFFFSIGTNPEVMVLLEAQGPTVAKAAWRYAVAPLTVAPLEVAIDKRQVWSMGYHSEQVNTPSGSYYTVRYPRLKP
jgi:hypothetical protein